MSQRNVIIHMGTKETAPANNLTDAEFDLIIEALGKLGVYEGCRWNETNALHTKLLFNKWNYVKPNTATTHADLMDGDITDQSVYFTKENAYLEVSTRLRQSLFQADESSIEGSVHPTLLEETPDSHS